MSDVKKIAPKMKRHPNNISFEEATKVLEYCGYYIAGIKGSYHRFKNKEGNVFILPHRKPVKAVYIKLIIKIFNDMG
jgi:predicted RNA binding protein YcfA (HicA-like mRNA interferase family)